MANLERSSSILLLLRLYFLRFQEYGLKDGTFLYALLLLHMLLKLLYFLLPVTGVYALLSNRRYG